MKEYILAVLGSLALFIEPVFPLIILVGIFIIADTIFGVWSSKKLGKPIISRKLFRLVSKFVVYTTSILLVWGLDSLIISEFITPFLTTKIVAAVLCFIEGFSIDEKLRSINEGKGVIYYLDKFTKFIKGVKDKFNEITS
jgi:hypothetical protein